MAISMNEAQFLGLFLEAFMVGILCTLCCVIAFTQLRLPTHHSTGWLIPVTSLMLVMALAHLIIDFIRAFHAFVRLVPFYYLNFKDPLFLVKTVLLAVQTLVGDCVLVWRCYIIYNKRVWVVIIPALLTIGGLVTTGANAAIWAHARTSNRQDAFLPWVTAYFSLTLAVNLHCTCVISLWCGYHARKLPHRLRTFRPIVIVLIESGALYTVNSLGAIGTQAIGNFGNFTAVALLPSTVGIIYCLIILQIKYGSETYKSLMLTTTQEVTVCTLEIETRPRSTSSQHRSSRRGHQEVERRAFELNELHTTSTHHEGAFSSSQKDVE